MTNTIPLSSLEEELQQYHADLRAALDIEKIKDYMDDPESLNEKARAALLPYGANVLIATLQLAFYAKSEQVRLSALKELKNTIFGTGTIGDKESELAKLLDRMQIAKTLDI